MKILIVTHYFWPEQFRINDLALELKARGHDVGVLTGMPNYPSGRLFEGYDWWRKRRDRLQGVPIYRVPVFLRRQGRGWQLALNYGSFVLSTCLLAPWHLRRREVDLIFVYEPSPFTVGIPAILLRQLKQAPLLFWVQDLWPESLTAAGAVRERVFYYPNWAESFYRPLAPSEADLQGVKLPEGFRVIFAGNLGEAQSLETIVAAAERLKSHGDIQWLIVGDGRRGSWMRQQVADRGLGASVTFLGSFPPERMPHLFAHADLLLVTLKDDPVFARTVPSKVQSYMACGRPIAAALGGEGARVIAQSGAGVAVNPGDDQALAAAVLRLYQSPLSERAAMGRAGRAYYEAHYSRDMLITRLEQWMDETVKEGRCAS